jgi:hypothetical protein
MGIYALTMDGGRIATYTNNTINGEGNCNIGYYTSSCADPNITLTGGSLNNIENEGVLAVNWDPVWSSGIGMDAMITVDNVAITMATGGVGVEAYADPTHTTNASATVTDNCHISGGATGVLADGPTATVTVTNNLTTITGNLVGIDIKDGASLASCTGNTITSNSNGGIIIESNAGTIGTISHNIISGNGLTAFPTHGLGLSNQETSITVNAINNYWGDPSGPYNNPDNTCGLGNAVSANVTFMPWWTTSTGPDGSGTLAVHNVTKGTYYCKIQDAINDANPNDEIDVAAGSYYEDLLVNKPITLKGNNAGLNGCLGGHTNPESIIYPFSNDPNPNSPTETVIIYVDANNVTIDGFTIDGHSGASSTYIIEGVTVNAGEGIAAWGGVATLNIKNNIIQNLTDRGIDIYNYYNSAAMTTGNEVNQNKLFNINPLGLYSGGGIGVLVYDNAYTDITYNCMDQVRVGIQTGNYSQSNASNASPVFSYNNISSYVIGIWHNLAYSNASIFDIDHNQIQTTLSSTGNNGIEISSLGNACGVSLTNNSVTGTMAGINLWNNPTTATVTVDGTNTFTNCNYGVFANNYDGYNSPAASSSYIVNGCTITNPQLAGVYVKDNPSAPGATVSVLAEGNTIVTGSTAGMKAFAVEGANASLLFSGTPSATITGAPKYIVLQTNGSTVPAGNIDATGVVFDGKLGSGMSLAQLFATEDKIDHKIDNSALGFVLVNADNDYITPNSFIWPVTQTPSIQRGIDAASATFTVNIEDGNYTESNINVNKGLNILGQDRAGVILGPSVADGHQNNPFTDASQAFIVESSGVNIQKLTIDGNANIPLGTLNFRNGIVTDENGNYNNITASYITFQNIYRRGVCIYMMDAHGTGMNFSNNSFADIGNGLSFESGAGIMLFDADATIATNTFTNCGNGIGTNYLISEATAPLCSITGNTISVDPIQGIGLDISGLKGGSLISGNVITQGYYGMVPEYFTNTSVTPVTITTNNISGVQYGIYLYALTDVLDVLNNTITGPSTSGSRGIYFSNTFAGENPGATSKAQMTGNNISGCEVGVDLGLGGTGILSANTISGNGTGLSVSGSALMTSCLTNYIKNNTGNGISVAADAGATGLINDNDLSGNGGKAIDNLSAPTLSATCNWYGTTDYNLIWPQIVGNVTFVPYLVTSNIIIPDCSGEIPPVHDVTQNIYYNTIQSAISDSRTLPNDVITVAAGTYTEDVTITKTLTLEGANAGLTGCDTRVAESIINPFTINSSSGIVVKITANGVVLDGFTIDGNNNSSEGIDASSGQANLDIKNNIVQNLTIAGIYLSNDLTGTMTSGNQVHYNKIDYMNPITSLYGIGVYTGNNTYADIKNNCMTNVRKGIQGDENFNLANTGNVSPVWSGNVIQSYKIGIWNNLVYQNATPVTIDDNTLTTMLTSTINSGIEISSIQDACGVIITNNNVTGANAGINLWNCPTSSTVTVAGSNTFTNCNYGVFANNYDGYASNAGSSSYIIDGCTITNPIVAGIYVKDNYQNTNNATVAVNVAGTIINETTPGGTAIVIEGQNASLSFSGATPQATITGVPKYIVLQTNGTSVPAGNIDATGVVFDGNLGSGMSLAQLFATEDKIDHKIDLATLGFVLVNAGNDYVTPNSFVAPNITPLIQRGVDAASNTNFTVNVENGSYYDNVVVNKSVEIAGESQGGVIVYSATNSPNPIPGGGSLGGGESDIFLTQADNIKIHDLTVNGMNGAVITARNGIIENYNAAPYVFNGLTVYNTTVANIYLRGIYASSGGTGFNIHDNTVSNVTSDPESIPIMNWGGSGTFAFNHVSASNDGIVSNWSSGTEYNGNTVTNCGSGIHTDNCGGPDVIENNTISNSPAGGYGIFLFSPYTNVVVQANTITNVEVGLACTGSYGSPLPLPVFTENTVDGQNRASSIGFYSTTEIWGYASGNQNVLITNNFIKNNVTGFLIASQSGFTNTTTANNNSITGNTTGVVLANDYRLIPPTGTFALDMTCNWWGATSAAAVAAAIGPSAANVNYSPWLVNGTDNDLTTPGFQPVPGSCSGSPVLVTLFSETDVSCIGGSDGAINITVTGGSGIYTFLWVPGNMNSQNISGLTAQTYTVTVTDTYGTTATFSQTVGTVPDITPPVIHNCPSNITVYTGPGRVTCDQNATWIPPTATDNCHVASFTSNYNPGDLFPVGTTTVTYTAIDNATPPNTTICSFTVTVIDNTPPSITCATPALSYNADQGHCYYTVSGTVLDPVTSDNCGVATVVNNFNNLSSLSGAQFPVGTTLVTWTVTDIHNNINTCSYSIVVVDNQPPSITCATPALSYNADQGHCYYTVPGTALDPATSDNCGVATVVNNFNNLSSLSGAHFAVGTTAVTWTVTDVHNNSNTCSYSVVVADNQPPSITCATPAPSYNADQGHCYYTVPGTALDPATGDNCGVATIVNNFNNLSSLNGAQIPVGTTNVTWTVTDVHSNINTCSYSLVVDDIQPPSIFCPPDQLNVGVNTALCTAVISVGTATATDNCGIQSIAGTRSDFPLLLTDPYPVGTTTINWVATDIHLNTSACVQTITVVANTLDGYLKYYNSAQTIMNNVTLSLNPGGLTSTTDVNGYYSFPSLCAGTYTVGLYHINKTAGGVNATDAAQVNGWGTSGGTIEMIKAYAGDVSETGDYQLNSADAGRILQYFVQNGNPTWSPRGLWTIYPAGRTINHNPLPTFDLTNIDTINIPVSGASRTVNLYGLCTGDYNGSFTPNGAKEASNTLSLTYGTTLQEQSGNEFYLPVSTESAIDVGAVSLILNFPSDKLEIMGVTLADNANTPMSYNVIGNELRIGWYSRENLMLNAGDKLLTLKVKLLVSLEENEILRFTLAADPLNELADAVGIVIPDAVLNIDLVGSTLGINPGSGSETLRFMNYPNPFTGTTTLAYSLPIDGSVTIELLDMTGILDRVIMDNVQQTSGDYKLVLDASNLPDGVYMATLKLNSDSQIMTRTIKIVKTY